MSDEPGSSEGTIEAQGSPGNSLRRDRMRAALFGDVPRIRTLDRFEIRGELGRGGMGVVLEALDPALDRPVALKLLHPRFDTSAQASLMREARLLAKVAHPHVVHVYDVGQIDGRAFVAMELIRGQTLRRWQVAEPRAWAEILDAYRQAGRGLAAAHSAGVIHRDFKPHNCIRDDAGHVRVVDFGLADHSSAQGESTGGTRAYMAPEQLGGGACDARSDQFSFCVALFEALHGVNPTAGNEGRAQGGGRCSEARGRVPRWVDRALERGLASEPERRWPDMDALLHALRPRGRGRWALASLVVGAGVGAVGVGLLDGEHEPAEPCRGAERRVAEVWDVARRGTIHRAMLGTGLPMAAETWSRVHEELDGYMERWARVHLEVCRSTWVRGEPSVERLDTRMACLDERLDAADRLLALLEEPDAEVVIAAIDAVHELPQPEPCRRREVEQSSESPEATELRRDLVQVLAERDVGRPQRALDRIEALHERAVAMEAPRLAAELLVRRGEVEKELGRGRDADRTLDDAVWAALAVGHDEAAFEAAVAHAWVVGALLVEEERGLARVGHARALLGRIGAPDHSRRTLERVAGLVLGRHGRYEDAMQSLRRAEELVEPGSRESLDLVMARANVALWCDHLDEGRSALERHLELAADLYGPHHPEVAVALNALAVVEIQSGRAGSAEARARAAVQILREAVGDHPRVADALMNLAGILMMSEADGYEGVVHLLEEARRIYVGALGEGSAKVADVDLAMAITLERLGRLEDAERAYRRNLEVQRRLKGARHVDLRRPLLALGTLLLDTGRAAEAIEPLQRSLELEQELARAAGQEPGDSEHVQRLLDLLERANEARGR